MKIFLKEAGSPIRSFSHIPLHRLRFLKKSSVEHDSVQYRPVALGLELLHELVNVVVEVRRLLHKLDQLAQEEGADRGLLVVVLHDLRVGTSFKTKSFFVSPGYPC